MSRDDCYTDVERQIAKTVERTPADIPTTSKEKQASKRAMDMPAPSKQTRYRGNSIFGKR